jgi:hypothetical protein
MILGDLLNAPVRDESGNSLGYVIDARLILDGPPPASGGLAGARLHGLLVSPRGAGSFLGYERTTVRSPWPLAAWFRYRHRGTFLVHWGDVVRIPQAHDRDRGDAVVVRDGCPRYDPALPLRPSSRRGKVD